MPPRTKKVSEEAFSQHRGYITQMYLSRSLKLDEICGELKTRGLTVKQSQLRHQLKKWKLRTNIRGDDWRHIGHLVRRRRQQGKETGVFFGQFYYGPTKVAKEVSRNCPLPLISKFQREPTPVLPEDLPLRICTPRPAIIDTTWPSTIPWLQFQAQYADRLYRSLPTHCFPDDNVNGIHDQIALPRDLLQLDIFQSNRPRSFAPDEIHCSSLLSSKPQASTARRAFDALLFMFSNNIDQLFDFYAGTKWDKNFQLLASLLDAMGLTKVDVKVESIVDTTLAATIERLRTIAINGVHKGLLDPTLHPQAMALLTWIFRSTAGESLKRIETILFWASIPSTICARRPESISEHGRTESNWPKFLEVDLACHGKTGRTVALQLVDLLPGGKGVAVLLAALSSTPPNLDLAKFLLESRPILAGEFLQMGKDGIVSILTPQVCAACLDEEPQAVEMLRLITTALHARNSSMTRQEMVNILTMACLKGHNGLIQMSIRNIVGFDIEECNSDGVSPLQAAAAGGLTTTCELLLAMGARADSPKSPRAGPLFWALHNGHVDVAKLLLKCNPLASLFTDGRYSDGSHENLFEVHALLHYAINLRNPDLVGLVLKLGADPNGGDSTPLRRCLLAAESGQKERSWGRKELQAAVGIARNLLEAGAIVNPGDVSRAARSGSAELVQALQEHDVRGIGEDEDEPAWFCLLEQTLLHEEDDMVVDRLMTTSLPYYDSRLLCVATLRACMDNDYRPTERLLHKRSSAAGCDKFEATAIGAAAAHGNHDLLRVFMAHFQPPFHTSKGYIPVSNFQWDPDCSICKPGSFLVTCRCLWTTQNWDETTWHGKGSTYMLASPLAAAVVSGTPESSIAMLRGFGFAVDRFTVAVSVSFGFHELSRSLIEHCATWDTGRRWWSREHPSLILLNYAVRNNDKSMMQILLSSGEDPNQMQYCQEEFGRSPLQVAVEHGSMEGVKLLLAANAEVNGKAAPRCGATALQMAGVQGYLDFAKLLLDKGADVNAPGARFEGRTALQGAAENGRLDMAAYLLSSGAETTGKYRKSFIKAVALARNGDHHVLERMLKESRGWSHDDEDCLQQLVSQDSWFTHDVDRIASSDEDSDEDNDEDEEVEDESSQLGGLGSSDGKPCSDPALEEFGRPTNMAEPDGGLSAWLQEEGMIGTAVSPWLPEFEPIPGDFGFYSEPLEISSDISGWDSHAEHGIGPEGLDATDIDGRRVGSTSDSQADSTVCIL